MKTLLTATIIFSVLGCSKPAEKIVISRNNVKIDYTLCGSGDTTLLFIHGWCINKEYWSPQIAYFCRKYRIVAIDLPGFGNSGKEKTSWSIDDYAEDVKAVIDGLHLKNVFLIGHSMSGSIVIRTAAKYPQSIIGIVGVDNLNDVGTPEPFPEVKKQLEILIDQFRTAFDKTIQAMAPGMLFQPSTDSAIVNRVMFDFLKTDSAIATTVIESLIFTSHQDRGFLQKLPVKLHLINCSGTQTDEDALKQYCKFSYKLLRVPATSHYPMIETPKEFNEALEKAIGNVE